MVSDTFSTELHQVKALLENISEKLSLKKPDDAISTSLVTNLGTTLCSMNALIARIACAQFAPTPVPPASQPKWPTVTDSSPPSAPQCPRLPRVKQLVLTPESILEAQINNKDRTIVAIGLPENGKEMEQISNVLGSLSEHVEAVFRVGNGQPTDTYFRPLKIRLKSPDAGIKADVSKKLSQARIARFVRRDLTKQELAFDRMLRVLVKKENERMQFRCFTVRDLRIEFTSAGIAMKEALEVQEQ